MVTKNGISGEMSVNREIVAMESSELVNLMAVNEAHPLYLGGVPSELQFVVYNWLCEAQCTWPQTYSMLQTMSSALSLRSAGPI